MWLLIFLPLLLLPLPAFAEFVDQYGNPIVQGETYRQMPGGAAWRDPSGGIHYENVRPSNPAPQSTPSRSPSMHSQPRYERYESLRDVTPDTGRSYSDSLFSDRVRPSPPSPY